MPTTVPDFVTQLHALAAQDREADLAASERKHFVDQQRSTLRKTYFNSTTAELKLQISQLATFGFPLPQIAKALGLTSASATTDRKPSGPSTYRGWFTIFRTRAIHTYLTSHPDFVTSLTKQLIEPSDFATHIPAADLSSLEATAHTKALGKCPAATHASSLHTP